MNPSKEVPAPKTLGELVWWATPDAELPGPAVQEALEAHGLGAYVADRPTHSPADLAALVQKAAAAMTPYQVKARSGIYFVPAEARDKFVAFGRAVLALGGSVSHSPVADTEAGRKIAREAVRDGLLRGLDEIRKVVAGYTDVTDSRTLKATAGRLIVLRTAIEALGHYLGEARDGVVACAETVREELKAKVDAATRIAV